MSILAGARDFLSSKTIQTSYDNHPASSSVSTGVLSWGMGEAAWERR